MGRRNQLRCRRGARVFVGERRLLDRRIPSRRSSSRRDAEHQRPMSGAHHHDDSAPRARSGQRSKHFHRRGERAGGHAVDHALWRRRAMERRLAPRRDGRRDRPPRGLLHRLPRRAAGIRLGSEIWISLSGPILRMAEETARNIVASSAAREARLLPAES